MLALKRELDAKFQSWGERVGLFIADIFQNYLWGRLGLLGNGYFQNWVAGRVGLVGNLQLWEILPLLVR